MGKENKNAIKEGTEAETYSFPTDTIPWKRPL